MIQDHDLFMNYFMYTKFISLFFFFFNDTATTEIYTLSLHDALPISASRATATTRPSGTSCMAMPVASALADRKSTRLNSSHTVISYAVFCLKKKKYAGLYSNSPQIISILSGACLIN